MSNTFMDQATLSDLEYKYLSLVWYARSDPLNKRIQKNRAKIENSHPKEVAELKGEGDVGDSNWHHGFNSGCLAMVRLVMTDNLEVFPDLDT